MIETMTQTTYKKAIPNNPRYKLIKQILLNILLQKKSSRVPISLTKLADSYFNLELRSYSWYQKYKNVSKEYIIENVTKSEEGALLKFSDAQGNEEYFILYESNKMVGRKRFTIAHELAHYILKHHDYIDGDVLSRGGLTQKEYRVLEQEANFFARMLLVPLSLLPYMVSIWGTLERDNIMEVFNVTYSVAGNVINHINNQANSGFLSLNRKVINKFRKSLNRFINIHICADCKAEFVLENPSYCPICGNYKILHISSRSYQVYYEFERNDYMIYDGIEVDENSKAKSCPECGNEESELGDHCSICGTFLVNKCTNDMYPGRTEHDGKLCGELLDGNARYCTHCGEPSTFLNSNILLNWYAYLKDLNFKQEYQLQLEPIPDDEIPF